MDEGTWTADHAVRRPRPPTLDKAAVVFRVEVTRGHHQSSFRRECAQRADHGLAVSDSERAAREEIALHIDREQGRVSGTHD